MHPDLREFILETYVAVTIRNDTKKAIKMDRTIWTNLIKQLFWLIKIELQDELKSWEAQDPVQHTWIPSTGIPDSKTSLMSDI